MIKGNLSVVQDELNFPSPSFPRPTLSLSLSRFLLSPTHVTHAHARTASRLSLSLFSLCLSGCLPLLDPFPRAKRKTWASIRGGEIRGKGMGNQLGDLTMINDDEIHRGCVCVDLAGDTDRSSLATDQSVRFWRSTDLRGAGRPIGVHGCDGRHPHRHRLDPRGSAPLAIHGIQRRETRATDEHDADRACNAGPRGTLHVYRNQSVRESDPRGDVACPRLGSNE